MSHSEAKVTSKGQITIPVAVREYFGLKAGDVVDFFVDEPSNEVRIRARNGNAAALFGSLDKYAKPGGRPATVEAMDESVRRQSADDDERIKRESAEWSEFQTWKNSKPAQAAE